MRLTARPCSRQGVDSLARNQMRIDTSVPAPSDYQNKPHWQVARQALNHAGASDASEIQAWRTFRAAAAAEGWLVE